MPGRTDPVEVFVRRSGTGPVVTFLHGWPTSSHDFHATAPLLDDSATLLFLDLPGYGASAKPDGAYPIAGQADVVAAVWQHLGVEQTVVVAHDVGTIVAQELVARREGGFAAGFPAVFGTAAPPTTELLAQLWAGISRDDGHLRWPQLLGYMAEREGQAERHPDAVVTRLADVGHWPQLERPDAVAAAIRAVLPS